jgi:hypothetical protein
MSQEILERRYRRLLACYPPAYRAAYGEEMLAVAMAAAGPGRRWPDPGEAADLIFTGLRRRLGSVRPASLDPAWRDAGGIAAVIGPIAMAAFAAAPLPGTDGWRYFTPASFSGIIVAALWFVVAVAGMLRWRRFALAGSCVLSAGLIYELARGAARDPYEFGALWWKVVFAALIAGSALLALKSKQRLLSWRAATATAVIAMLLAVLPAIQGQLRPGAWGAASFTEMNSYMQLQTSLHQALPAGLALVLLVVVARQKAGVRSRLMIMLVAAAATFAVDMAAFSGILSIEDPLNNSPLGPGWWQSPAVLVAVPVLCFAFGATCLTRDERRPHRRDRTDVPVETWHEPGGDDRSSGWPDTDR